MKPALSYEDYVESGQKLLVAYNCNFFARQDITIELLHFQGTPCIQFSLLGIWSRRTITFCLWRPVINPERFCVSSFANLSQCSDLGSAEFMLQIEGIHHRSRYFNLWPELVIQVLRMEFWPNCSIYSTHSWRRRFRVDDTLIAFSSVAVV